MTFINKLQQFEKIISKEVITISILDLIDIAMLAFLLNSKQYVLAIVFVIIKIVYDVLKYYHKNQNR